MSSGNSSCSKEVGIMKQIFQNVMRRSEVCWNRKIDLAGVPLDSKTKENYKSLTRWMFPDKWETLNSLLTKACSKKMKLRSCDVGNFYLPPFSGDDAGFVPVFNLDADFSKELPEVNIRVALLSYDEETGRLRVFGCRFETPEPGSNHDFCHAQFTRDPLGFESREGEPCELMAEWSPENIPCILAPAKGPAALLVWMIVGIYGKKSSLLFSSMRFEQCYREPLRYLDAE